MYIPINVFYDHELTVNGKTYLNVCTLDGCYLQLLYYNYTFTILKVSLID